jgi:hypothetical protein
MSEIQPTDIGLALASDVGVTGKLKRTVYGKQFSLLYRQKQPLDLYF